MKINLEQICLYADRRDAVDTLPPIQDFRFYVSLVIAAFKKNVIDQPELNQFLRDLPRTRHVAQDGIIQEDFDAQQLLQSFVQIISTRTGVPTNNIINAVCTLNQGAGNIVPAFLNQFNEFCSRTESRVSFYMPIRKSDTYHSAFRVNGNTISIHYALPLKAVFENSTDHDLENFDPNNPDATAKSTIKIDLNKKSEDPEFVTHTMELENRHPDLTLAYVPRCFDINQKTDVYHDLAEDQNYSGADDWTLVPRPITLKPPM